MIRKILAALLSSLLFCMALALVQYMPESHQQPDTYGSFVTLYLVYVTPVYVVGGVLASMLIEALNHRIAWVNPVIVYLFRVIAYAVAGMLLMMLFQAVVQAGIPTHRFPLSQGYGWGMVASLVYMHVWLTSFLVVKEKRRRW